MTTVLIFSIVAVHFLIILLIGWHSWRASKPTPEDYFMGSRGFGTLVLVVSIYATNMTAFYIIGIPAAAYHQGVGLFGYVGCAVAIFASALYYLVGYRAWLLGKSGGYMTQPELYGQRWNSTAVKIVYFVFLLIFTIPYLCVSIIGGGVAVNMVTKGSVPYWAGCLLVLVIVTTYVTAAGMRGTAWVNVYQGFVFMIVGIVSFVLLGQKLGGFSKITTQVLVEKAGLLMREGNFTPKIWVSYIFLAPLAVITYPQVFMKLLVGKSTANLKKLTYWYPIMILLTWPPIIFIGLWGSVLNPGLVGKAADSILPWMFAEYLPVILIGIAIAGILAALMSSVDAMFLSLGTMLSRDILMNFFPEKVRDKQVAWGRIFIIVLSITIFGLALLRPSSVFKIATFAFTGFVCSLPMMIGGLVWKRATKYGALASLVIPVFLIPVYEFTDILNSTTLGFLYVVPLLAIGTLLFIVVSLLTPADPKEHTAEFFGVLDRVYGSSRKGKK